MAETALLNLDAVRNEKSATQRAYGELRRMIILGEIEPGMKLKIEELRQRLDIGASPIREALSLLVSDQLVVRLDQRGFMSAGISKRNFSEILELRCMLEERALRQSIERATTDWEEKVVLAHHRLLRAKDADVETMEDTHKAYHMELISNCGAPLLLGYCDQLYDLNIRYRFVASAKPAYKNRNVKAEHQGIVDAVLERNADLACQRLMEHYSLTGEFLARIIYE